MFTVTGYTYICNRNTTYSLKNGRLVSGNVVLRMFVLNPLKAQSLYELCGEMYVYIDVGALHTLDAAVLSYFNHP